MKISHKRTGVVGCVFFFKICLCTKSPFIGLCLAAEEGELLRRLLSVGSTASRVQQPALTAWPLTVLDCSKCPLPQPPTAPAPRFPESTKDRLRGDGVTSPQQPMQSHTDKAPQGSASPDLLTSSSCQPKLSPEVIFSQNPS